MNGRISNVGLVSILVGALLHPGSWGGVRAAAQDDLQTVLGPGLYVFQTRTSGASCGDDERTGYVSTFIAPIHGVPGSRSMRMQLVNSPYWANWTIRVDASNRIIGDIEVDGRTNHFEVTANRGRFTGEGVRTYNARIDGAMRRCQVTYDALLRRIDGL